MFLDTTIRRARRALVRVPVPSIARAAGSAAIATAAAIATVATVVPFAATQAQHLGPPVDPGRRLDLALEHLDQSARLLYVTAHPDDEDSGLLARLHFGDGIRVRLLTLTRGEGGQNEIGTELFDGLGVLRSRELEASAEWLGNEQRFSRAFEFGYSFSVEETYALWNEEKMLRDLVYEIREFRPQVILTMQPDGDGGGQHHQASARLTESALEIAASTQWPELGSPHLTSRLFHQLWRDDGGPVHVDLDLGVYDPILGATYQEYGLRARESHQCQGMARLHAPLTQARSKWRWIRSGVDPVAASGDPGPRAETPRSLPGFFEGLPVRTGDRKDPRSEFVSGRIESIREAFTLDDVETGIDRLLDLLADEQTQDAETRSVRSSAEGSPESDPTAHPSSVPLRTRIAEAVRAAYGLTIHARATTRYAAAGDSLHLGVHAAATRPLRLRLDTLLPGEVHTESPPSAILELTPNVPGQSDFAFRLAGNAAPTLPRPVPRPGTGDESAAGSFGSPRWNAFHIRPTLLIGDFEIPLDPLPVLHQEVDPEHPRVLFTDLHVVPEPSVRPLVERIPMPIAVGADGARSSLRSASESRSSSRSGSESGSRSGSGSATSADRSGAKSTWLVSSLEGGSVEVSLTVPDGWTAEPRSQQIELRPEIEVPVTFSLFPGDGPAPGEMTEVEIRAEVRHLGSGATSRQGYQRVEYDHVRPDALLVPARCRIVPIPCRAVPDLRIAYVEGSGDRTLEAIERLGYHPTRLDESALLQGDLDAYDVIVTGVRAYKVREDLSAAQPRLLDWVRRGGTLLVQYNKFEFNGGAEDSSPFAPFPETLVGRRRVTVEESPVIVEHPEHAVFHRPNRIGPADWDGWVQERGLYFLDFEDDRYIDLLTLEDPWPYNAGAKGGALVDAPLGDGHWVYIGVGLFRQLPAAVPGAYRLLANLLALGAKESP